MLDRRAIYGSICKKKKLFQSIANFAGRGRSPNNSSSVSWLLSGGSNNSAMNSAPFADVLSVLTRNNPGCSTVAAAAVLMTTTSAPPISTSSSYQNSVLGMNSGHGSGGFRGSFTSGLSLQQKSKVSAGNNFFLENASNINKI